VPINGCVFSALWRACPPIVQSKGVHAGWLIYSSKSFLHLVRVVFLGLLVGNVYIASGSLLRIDMGGGRFCGRVKRSWIFWYSTVRDCTLSLIVRWSPAAALSAR